MEQVITTAIFNYIEKLRCTDKNDDGFLSSIEEFTAKDTILNIQMNMVTNW